MEITIDNIAEQTIINIKGRIDTATSPEFEKAIAPVIAGDMKDVIMECKDFEYISSTGLRLFLVLQKSANAKKGSLLIRNMNDDIKNVFNMTGFTALFKFE
ncbi:MAG: anti-sigma factor antagonist [Bacteroidetes bacterium]|nr:anti-sigma factor antagonist [Bacteroidota bacterium]